jgi:hypothetical protein
MFSIDILKLKQINKHTFMNKVNSSALRREVSEAMLQRKYVKSKQNNLQATFLVVTAVAVIVASVVLTIIS